MKDASDLMTGCLSPEAKILYRYLASFPGGDLDGNQSRLAAEHQLDN